MSKHTPGPWEIKEFLHDIKIMSPTMSSGALGGVHHYAIAELRPVVHGEKKANARLIAAAPEMLEALKAIHKCLFLHSEYPKICQDVDAAIAKAEGER